MLTNWYGKAASCSDAGFCRHTGGICRPTACPMMAYVPDDNEQERTSEND